MSDYATLISSGQISPPDFIAFIQALGGHISSEEHLDGGISKPDGAIWFYGARKKLERDVVHVGCDVTEQLGGAVRAEIDFELSSRPASQQLMLDVAVEFTRRWPGVMQCAAHRVLTQPMLADITTKGAQDKKLILGPDLRLYFATDISDLVLRSLATFAGLTLCAPVGEGMAPTASTLSASNISSLDPEDVMGWVEAEGGKVWVSYVFEGGPEDDADDIMTSNARAVVRERLGQEARYFSVLAIGYGASKESEALCLRLAQRIMKESSGVAVGLLDSVLNAETLRRLASAGRGFVD